MKSKIFYEPKTPEGLSAWVEEQVEGTFDDLSSDFHFVEYIDKRPHIWREFRDFSFQAIRSGATKLSSKMIINRLRWYGQIEKQEGDRYKIDDQCHSFLARMFVSSFPDHADKFDLRSTRKTKKS